MRHRKKKVTLGRTRAPRKSLMRNLATSLILYEKIQTTKAKAHAVRPIVEQLITMAKENSLTTRRRLSQTLFHENAVRKALDVLGPRYKERAGGYTRTTKLGQRRGDAAEMVQIELL